MAKWLVCGLLLAMALSSCGGPDLCACEREAVKENPDRELMEECAGLYEGRSYEEIEQELEGCK